VRHPAKLGHPAAVALALALATLLGSCAAHPMSRSPVVPPRSGPAGTQTGPTGSGGPAYPDTADGGPVRAPAFGALFGAWVRPASTSQPERIAAVTRFQQLLGRRLDIVNTYRRFTDPLITESDRHFLADGSTLMISWAGAGSQAVLAGRYDWLLRDRARQIAALGRPILLRYRWEMDRPNLAGTTGTGLEFILAWRHLRDVFVRERATNVAWVWCPTADGFAHGYAPGFYPGDDQVDWICVDGYAGARLDSMSGLLDPFLHWAQRHAKPLMIGEFGVARAYSGLARAQWLTGAATLIKSTAQIKAVSYFESNPDNRPANQQFRLGDDPIALAALRALASDPYFDTAPG
jgi:hypothetical protein